MLGRGVGGKYGLPMLTLHRRHIDDPARLLCYHCLQHAPRCPEGRIDIPLHSLVEGFVREIHHRLQIACAAGIVDENIDRAEIGHRAVNETFHIALLHYIARNEYGAVADIQFGEHFGAFIGVASEQCHFCSFRQKGLGDAATQTGSTACDCRDFSFEFHVSLLDFGSLLARSARNRTSPK